LGISFYRILPIRLFKFKENIGYQLLTLEWSENPQEGIEPLRGFIAAPSGNSIA
jgi:hypothetical protein